MKFLIEYAKAILGRIRYVSLPYFDDYDREFITDEAVGDRRALSRAL